MVPEDFLVPSPLQLQREADEDVAHEDEKEGDEEDDAEDKSSRELRTRLRGGDDIY